MTETSTTGRQARLPESMGPGNLATMQTGEVAYTLPWGMWVDSERRCWLHPEYPAKSRPGGTVRMRVELRMDGYHVWPPHDETYRPQTTPGYVSPADTPWIPVAELHHDA